MCTWLDPPTRLLRSRCTADVRRPSRTFGRCDKHLQVPFAKPLYPAAHPLARLTLRNQRTVLDAHTQRAGQTAPRPYYNERTYIASICGEMRHKIDTADACSEFTCWRMVDRSRPSDTARSTITSRSRPATSAFFSGGVVGRCSR